MIFSTRVFSRSYESVNSYVKWPALPDSAMGMLQQFIRWYKRVSFVMASECGQAERCVAIESLLPDMRFLRIQYLDIYFFLLYILTIFLKLY